MLDDLKSQLIRAQHRMKANADKHRREEKFEIGEQVYLKLQPYKQKSLAHRPFEKLAPSYTLLWAFYHFGMYWKGGLQVGIKTSKLHPVFHVSQLKRAYGTNHQFNPLPPTLTLDLELVMEPNVVLGVRKTSQRLEVLIAWMGMPDSEQPGKTLIPSIPYFPISTLRTR